MTLTLKAIIHFFHKTLWPIMTYHQTKFGCQRISSSEDIVVRVIFWQYKPSLWPWPWRQNNFCFAWHSCSFCSITITSLVTKCFVVQKISSGQIFTDIFNLCCDLDLERNNPIFFRRTLLLIMLYYQTEFDCKRTCSLADIVEIVIFWLNKPSLWPWHWR